MRSEESSEEVKKIEKSEEKTEEEERKSVKEALLKNRVFSVSIPNLNGINDPDAVVAIFIGELKQAILSDKQIYNYLSAWGEGSLSLK